MASRTNRFKFDASLASLAVAIVTVLGCAKDEDLTLGALQPPGDPATAPSVEGGTAANDAEGASSSSRPPSTGIGATAGAAAGPIVAGRRDAGRGSAAGGECWQLPVVTAARLLPAPGESGLLAGGKLVGSNSSPTNDFVDIAVIESAPSDGEWFEIEFPNETAYRYVKYYAPAGSHGALAELELRANGVVLGGEPFGVAAAAGSGFERAFDGDAETVFRAALPSDAYVGLDLGAGHLAAAPELAPPPGTYDAPPALTLSAEPGAEVRYTLDGGDPLEEGSRYQGPLQLPASTTLVRAVARRECALPSEVAQGVYVLAGSVEAEGGVSPVQSSMHIGNSLTDTLVDRLAPLARSAGITLDFERYTIPGAGTWLYVDQPSGGFGVAHVQEALRTQRFDHLVMQPFPNMPCQVVPSADGADSDSGYIDQAWADARTQNPLVQLWIYQQWPSPADIVNCFSGGGWLRGSWRPPEPEDWPAAVMNELAYHEAVMEALIAANPDAPRPFIVPAGLGLLNLKDAVDAGRVPGIGSFFQEIFAAGGTDIHLTRPGAYFVTLIFYASMFQSDPATTSTEASHGVSEEQAAAFKAIAWETVTSYPWSGLSR